MSKLLITIVCAFFYSFAPSVLTLDAQNGFSYFLEAERIALDSGNTVTNRRLSKQLYVLSAVIDSSLRDSAIIGLLSIEEDEEIVQRLHGLRLRSSLPLVQNVFAVRTSDIDVLQVDSINQLCGTLARIRAGNKISPKELASLEPYRYLYPSVFDRLLTSAKQKHRKASDDVVTISLQLELAILGGATLWSADFAMTKGRPMALNRSDDLAALYNIDTKKIKRKNGVWVE